MLIALMVESGSQLGLSGSRARDKGLYSSGFLLLIRSKALVHEVALPTFIRSLPFSLRPLTDWPRDVPLRRCQVQLRMAINHYSIVSVFFFSSLPLLRWKNSVNFRILNLCFWFSAPFMGFRKITLVKSAGDLRAWTAIRKGIRGSAIRYTMARRTELN